MHFSQHSNSQTCTFYQVFVLVLAETSCNTPPVRQMVALHQSCLNFAHSTRLFAPNFTTPVPNDGIIGTSSVKGALFTSITGANPTVADLFYQLQCECVIGWQQVKSSLIVLCKLWGNVNIYIFWVQLGNSNKKCHQPSNPLVAGSGSGGTSCTAMDAGELVFTRVLVEPTGGVTSPPKTEWTIVAAVAPQWRVHLQRDPPPHLSVCLSVLPPPPLLPPWEE